MTHPHIPPAPPGLQPGQLGLDLIDVHARGLLEAGRVRFDGRRVPGLPPRLLGLAELRVRLLHPATTPVTCDLTWRLILTRVRSGHRDAQEWATAGLWLLSPGLRAAAGRLLRAEPVGVLEVAEVHADLIAAALAALAEIDPAGANLARRLVAAAFRSTRRASRAHSAYVSRRAPGAPAASPPPWPAGHPDMVLAAAVHARVLTAAQAEVIGETRLQHRPTDQLAAELGVNPATLRRGRARAERRLVTWLADGQPDLHTNHRTDHRERARQRADRRAGEKSSRGPVAFTGV